MTPAPLQSALDAAGRYAREIEWLWWVFFWVAVVVYVLVAAALAAALLRKRRGSGEIANERKALHVVTGATVFTILTLFFLLTTSVVVGRSLSTPVQPAVTIEVTGRQWWWQVDYDDPVKSNRFTTANELVIPVGVPVQVKLRTGDVIHSFWVPNLHGKRDLISGKETATILLAKKAGLYRGQCAEFCGLQHARMAFWVNAVPQEEYVRWVVRQRQPSKIPSTQSQRKGQEVFMSSPCPLCHTIAGTEASGKVAPDLTHFASRRSIAAGSLPNRRGPLAAWIVDPQHLKPGNYMPPNLLKGEDLDPLLDYLESLE